MNSLHLQQVGLNADSDSPAAQSTPAPIVDSAALSPGQSQPAQATTPSLDSLAIYQGKGYRLTALQTWEDAQAEAIGLNGNLVTINNAAEEAWLQETFGQDQTFWLGLTDQVEEGRFRSVTGEAVTYENWAPGQPDNHPNIEREDYAVMNFRGTGQWNDASALSTYRGIVEIDLSKVGLAETGSTETGSTEAGSTETGSNKTGSNKTGSNKTGSNETVVELDDVTGTWEPYRFWGQENFSLVPQTETPQFSEVNESQSRLLSIPDDSEGSFADSAEASSEASLEGGGDTLLRISMPAGSASPAVSQQAGRPLGGGEFLGHLRGDSVERLRLRYRLRFSENFDFVKGGKLPGLYGGTAPSGGYIPDGTDGFSTRFMWREDGAGEVYAYLPDSQNYGTSFGRGQWQFVPGQWQTLEQEVILNDPQQTNGQLRVWLDGKAVFSATDLQFRTTDDLKINGIYVSSFFGGGDIEYATPRDVHIDFADFEVWES